MDWSGIFGFLLGILTNIPKVIGFTKETLDMTKAGMEVFKGGQEIVDKMDKPDQGPERAKAAAELLRAITPLAWAEVTLYAIRGISLLVVFLWVAERLRPKKDTK